MKLYLILYIFIIFLTVLLISCLNNFDSMNIAIKTKGLPEDDLMNPSIYFISKDTGYICLSKCGEVEHDNYEVNTYLYETKDGGLNWSNVAFLPGQDVNTMVANPETVFLTTHAREQGQMSIYRYNINDKSIDTIFNCDAISSIWLDNSTLFFCETNNINKLLTAEKDSIKEQLILIDYINSGITIDGQVFAIFSNNKTNYFGDTKLSYQLPMTPDCLIRKNENTILIAGPSKTHDKNTSIKLVEFDCKTKQSKTIKVFDGYSYIDDLQSAGDIIVGFIGNMSSSIIEYDLFYSIDSGKKWKIIEMEDPVWIRPNCLMGDNLIIYKGFNQIDKILLK